MENNEVKNKTEKRKNILIIILSLAVLSLVGYIVYDEYFRIPKGALTPPVSLDQDNTENNDVEENNEINSENIVDELSEIDKIPDSEKKKINYDDYLEYLDLTKGVDSIYSDSNKINWKKEYKDYDSRYKLYVNNGILYYKDKNNTVKITNDKLSKEKVIGISVTGVYGYVSIHIKTESNKIYSTDGEEGEYKLSSKFKNELKKNISLFASDVKELYDYPFGAECAPTTFTTYITSDNQKKVLYYDFNDDFKVKSIDYDKYNDTRYVGGCGNPALDFNFGNFEMSYGYYNESTDESKDITFVDTTTNNAIIASYIATLGSNKLFIISKDNDLYILDYEFDKLSISLDGKITSEGKCRLEKKKKSIKISTKTAIYVATSAE